MVVPPAPSPLPPPHQPPNPYLQGQLGNIYGYSSPFAPDVVESEEEINQRRYRRAVDELRGESRLFVALGALATLLGYGIYRLALAFPVMMGWVGVVVGGVIVSALAFYGISEAVFRLRRPKLDEEWAVKLMTGETK